MIHDRFNLNDCIGFSALIFGLLLSNSSIEKQSHKNTKIVNQQSYMTPDKIKISKASKKDSPHQKKSARR